MTFDKCVNIVRVSEIAFNYVQNMNNRDSSNREMMAIDKVSQEASKLYVLRQASYLRKSCPAYGKRCKNCKLPNTCQVVCDETL